MSLPLLVRPNSVIPMGNRADKPDYDYSDGVTLQVYQLEDGKQVSVEIPGLDGRIETSFEVSRESNMIQVRREGSAKAWNVFLVGIDSIKEIEKAEIINGSALIKANLESNEMKIHLR